MNNAPDMRHILTKINFNVDIETELDLDSIHLLTKGSMELVPILEYEYKLMTTKEGRELVMVDLNTILSNLKILNSILNLKYLNLDVFHLN